MSLSPEFRNFANFTAKKTIANRELSLVEIDPKLAAECGSSEPAPGEELRGEWYTGKCTVFSGFLGEAWRKDTLHLQSGELAEIDRLGHLNILEATGKMRRHTLTADGKVYADDGSRTYHVMDEAEFDSVLFDASGFCNE